MKSKTMKGLLATTAGVLALAVIVYVVWQRPNTDDLKIPPEAVQRPTVSPQPGPRAAQPPADSTPRATATEAESALGDTTGPAVRESLIDGTRIPHDVSFREVKSKLWEDIQANPPELLDRGDPLIDAELAYRIYTYYGNCTTAPRTSHAIDRQLEQIADHAERTASQGNTEHLEGIESHIERMTNTFEICLAIPPEVDARLKAVQWMTEAVHLGHEIAQVQFYEKAMGFLLRPDYYGANPPLVMKHPGLIDAFKATAEYALSQGMEKGHPEAYLAMSNVLLHGLIYPEDPVKAYAYVRTAEMKASESHLILSTADFQKQSIGQLLTQEQISEAEQLALDLWKESNQ